MMAARVQDIQGLKNYPTENEKPSYLICEEDSLTRPMFCSLQTLESCEKCRLRQLYC